MIIQRIPPSRGTASYYIDKMDDGPLTDRLRTADGPERKIVSKIDKTLGISLFWISINEHTDKNRKYPLLEPH